LTGAEASTLVDGVRSSLATLKDVAGIAGSFVCTQSGRLIAREIPALFEDAVLAEAGSRLLRIGETFAASGDELEVAVVRYGENRLYLKSIAGGMLCIVVAGPVNMPALRMAANLVGRRIAPAVSRAHSELPAVVSESAPVLVVAAPVPPSVPAPAVIPPSPPVAAPLGARRFRGRTVE
jgi:predicted regulator of Ras-like GTPase activity (Roadblock/LC7/MglB family)